jgi:drug/metabolite transporter (DMT)-like permease
LVNALPNSGHDSRGQVKCGVQNFLFDSRFPGVRQAAVHSRLAVAHNGNSKPHQFFLAISEQVGGVRVPIVLAKIRSLAHGIPSAMMNELILVISPNYRQSPDLLKTRAGLKQLGALGWGLFAIFCWGTLAAVAGSALEEVHPAWVLLGAFSASSLVFAFLPRLFRLSKTEEQIERTSPWRGRILGLWGIFFFHAFYFEAIRRAPIVEATLINYLWPLLIVLLAWGVLREPFHLAVAAGTAMGMAGAALVIGGQGVAFETNHLVGYGLAIASAFAWSSYTVFLRKWGGGREFLLTASLWSACLSGVWILLAGMPPPPPFKTWLAIAYLGAVAIGAAILAWERAVASGPISVLGAMAYLTPFLSAFFLWFILGKPIGALAAIGMVLIVAGGAVAARR